MIIDVPATPRKPLTARERLEVWERCRGYCKGPCGRKLRPGDKWQADHPLALGMGGPDDHAKLVVLCDWCFPPKNAKDTSDVARAKRVKGRHIGIKPPRSITGWKRMDGTPVRASRER